MKRKRRIANKVFAVLMAAVMAGSGVDYTALPAVHAAEDETGEQVAELTVNGTTTVYGSFMEAYYNIGSNTDTATIRLLEDSEVTARIDDKKHTVVLDLNGKTLSIDKNITTNAIWVELKSDWTICSSEPGGEILDTRSEHNIFLNSGKLTIKENVEMSTEGYNSVYGYSESGTAYIEGAVIDKIFIDAGAVNIASGDISQVECGSYGNLQISGGNIATLKYLGQGDINAAFSTGYVAKSTTDDTVYTRSYMKSLKGVDGYYIMKNITAVPCENHVNKAGYCDYCGTPTESAHEFDEDGVCKNCGLAKGYVIKTDGKSTVYDSWEELYQVVGEFTSDTDAVIKINEPFIAEESMRITEGNITYYLYN